MLLRILEPNDTFTESQIASQLLPGTDVLLTLVSSEILVGIETGGGARLGHVLKPHGGQTQHSVSPKVKQKAFPRTDQRSPRGSWEVSPDSVLESRQEASGDAESRVQKVFLLRRLEVLQVCVKFLCKIKEPLASFKHT